MSAPLLDSLASDQSCPTQRPGPPLRWRCGPHALASYTCACTRALHVLVQEEDGFFLIKCQLSHSHYVIVVNGIIPGQLRITTSFGRLQQAEYSPSWLPPGAVCAPLQFWSPRDCPYHERFAAGVEAVPHKSDDRSNSER